MQPAVVARAFSPRAARPAHPPHSPFAREGGSKSLGLRALAHGGGLASAITRRQKLDEKAGSTNGQKRCQAGKN